jgi:hypothetical protein
MVGFLSLLAVTLPLCVQYCALTASDDFATPSTIDEVDGLLYVTEPVNTFRMERHIQLWAADLHGQRDIKKLDLLLASKTIREMTLLMTSLKSLASKGTSSALPWLDSASPSPSLVSDKDNQV